MEDLNTQILKGFQIQSAKIRKDKSSYIVYAGKTTHKVRKVQTRPEHIVFQHEIKEHLFRQGFKQTDRYMISVQNKPYFSFDGSTYVMTDYFEYPEVNFYDPASFQIVLHDLAKMHSFMQNIPFSSPAQPHYNENMEETYRKSIQDLQVIKKKLGNKKRLSDFDVLFLKNYEFYIDMTELALNKLKEVNWASYILDGNNKKIVCHNLLKEENILYKPETKTETGCICFTNFTEASINHYIFDIAYIIRRYTKNLPENPIHITKIIADYHKNNPLSSSDIQFLYPLLKYPKKYLKICRQYYSKNRTWAPSAITARMQEEIDQKYKYNAFIDQLLSII